MKLNLTIYSKDVNGKEPAQDGKDIKDTFQSYSMTGKTRTATIKDNLYVKLSPGKDKESKKLFDKVLASDKYHVKIVFENADGTTAASLLDPKTVKSVQRVTDPETGTKYDAKKKLPIIRSSTHTIPPTREVKREMNRTTTSLCLQNRLVVKTCRQTGA